MNKIKRTDLFAMGLGLMGLAGTACVFSFKIHSVSYGVAWSMFFPTIAVVALGRRGALFASLAGLYVFFPFMLYNDGDANLVTFIITLAFFYAHGWAAEKRMAGSRLLRHRSVVVQIFYGIVIIPVYMVGYRVLSPGLFPDGVTALFGLKEAIYGLVSLVIAEGVLTLSRVRRAFELKTDESYRGSDAAMLGVLISGFAFAVLLAMADFFLLRERDGIMLLEQPASDILFMGWLVLSFLLGVGGKMASLLQKKLASDFRIIEEKERYKHIFENIEDIYYEIELDGTTLEMSPSVEGILGVKREAMIGRKTLLSEMLRDKIRMDGFLQNELATVEDVSGRKHALSVNARLVESANGKLKVVGNIRDVTELESSRIELVQMNQDLEKRVRLRTAELEAAIKELEAFSHTVSHDLKSPVRSVDSYCQFIVEDYGQVLPPDVRDMLGSIRGICGGMICFIQRLLEYSIVSKAELRPINFNSAEYIQGVIMELKTETTGREVTIAVSSELPEIWGDPVLFRQIVLNGMSNALKFTRTCQNAVIEINCEIKGNRARFSIADNGIGFEVEKAERLFDIFHKLHMPEEYEGAGIGLATVRKCAERQGGTAWITGTPDKGATLYFQMYLVEKEKTCDG